MSIDIKNKFFISPDKILLDINEALERKENYFAKIYCLKANPYITVYKKDEINKAIKVVEVGTENINLLPKKKTVFRTKILNQNSSTEIYNDSLFYDSWTRRGMIDRYLQQVCHSPHVCAYYDEETNIRYIKTSISTVFEDIYPMVANIDFDRYLIKTLKDNSSIKAFISNEQKWLSEKLI